MRYLIIILFLLCSNNILGQTKYNWKQGYKFIAKAKENLSLNKLEKAEKLLAKARKSNYGFCGNAWEDAREAIDLTQAKIHNQRKEFDKALSVLDSIDSYSIDTLKIKTLILKFGKEKVENAIEQANVILQDNPIAYYSSINLSELNYVFRFKHNPYYNNSKNRKIIRKANNVILEEFKKYIRNIMNDVS